MGAAVSFSLTSCYTTPGVYTAPDFSSKPVLGKVASSSNKTLRPTVKFPARIAFARVNSYSGNNIQLVNNREYETDEHKKIIGSLPNIAGVTHLSSAYLPSTNTNLTELRKATRRLGASMLAVYQFNSTSRTSNGSTILSVATLGAAPTNGHKATAHVTLTFIDAQTGYIYGVLEESATARRLSTTWGSSSASDGAEHQANQRAVDKLMKKLPAFWQTVYTR